MSGVRLRVMFSSPQWVNGEQRTQAEVELDHVVGFLDGERVINVAAGDLMILTAEDLPASVVEAIRALLPNAYTAWTKEQEATLRELWARGADQAEMVRVLDRRWSAIRTRAKRLDLGPRGGGTP